MTTPLRTPSGSVRIEDVRVGDLVLSRDEHDANGLVVAQQVEEVFVRQGLVTNLHLPNGVVIKTTAEHPFFVAGKGWVPCNELKVGDLLATEDGSWVPVEDILETGEYETVYNLRVANFHTYFVGSAEWGFAVWAHNTRCAPSANAERWMEHFAAKEGRGNVELVMPKGFVSDSNVFQDRAVIQGGVNVRNIFDDVLADAAADGHTQIVLPNLIKREISTTGPKDVDQAIRLGTADPHIQVVHTDVDGLIASHPTILSGNFGRSDLQLVETARLLGLPVVTSNSAMRAQIASNPVLNGMYGHVQLLIPHTEFTTSSQLMAILRTQK